MKRRGAADLQSRSCDHGATGPLLRRCSAVTRSTLHGWPRSCSSSVPVRLCEWPAPPVLQGVRSASIRICARGDLDRLSRPLCPQPAHRNRAAGKAREVVMLNGVGKPVSPGQARCVPRHVSEAAHAGGLDHATGTEPVPVLELNPKGVGDAVVIGAGMSPRSAPGRDPVGLHGRSGARGPSRPGVRVTTGKLGASRVRGSG